MKAKTTTVAELMSQTSDTASNIFALSITYKHWLNDGTASETPLNFSMTKADVMQLILLNWGQWSFVWYEENGQPVDFDGSNEVFEQFCNQFNGYKTRCLRNLQRQLEAYSAEYNPIENYNGNETENEEIDAANPRQSVKTISGHVRSGARVKGYDAAGGAVNDDGTIAAQPDWSPVATHSETAYNTTALKPVATDGTTMSAGSSMTVATENDNFTHWDNYTETTTEEGDKVTTRYRHGNLGVTMTQQMIEAELALRGRDLAKEWLKKFINETCVLTVPGVCDIEGM